MSNNNLTNAKKAKNDEFYTQYVDIEKELQYYNFEDKIVYCNCDNPQYSNFYKYFKDKFHIHKIKHLYCTRYNKDGNGYYAEYNGTEEILKPLNGNGSFDSDECINILKIADVIITNPPFSLFREYVAQLMEYGKKFLIIGNQNAITYKEIFPYIKNNELWLGQNAKGGTRKGNSLSFTTPNGETKDVSSCWFTNIPCIAPKQPLILTKTYNPIYYPQYDNYMAINVDKVKDIPIDYDGVMGVPITFLQYYNPKQFEILDARNYTSVGKLKNKSTFLVKDKDSAINGKPTYARILIKKNDSLEQVEFEIVGGFNGYKECDYENSLLCGTPTEYIDKNGVTKIWNGPTINKKSIYYRILIKRKQ